MKCPLHDSASPVTMILDIYGASEHRFTFDTQSLGLNVDFSSVHEISEESGLIFLIVQILRPSLFSINVPVYIVPGIPKKFV